MKAWEQPAVAHLHPVLQVQLFSASASVEQSQRLVRPSPRCLLWELYVSLLVLVWPFELRFLQDATCLAGVPRWPREMQELRVLWMLELPAKAHLQEVAQLEESQVSVWDLAQQPKSQSQQSFCQHRQLIPEGKVPRQVLSHLWPDRKQRASPRLSRLILVVVTRWAREALWPAGWGHGRAQLLPICCSTAL